jgi:hypothetical protein
LDLVDAGVHGSEIGNAPTIIRLLDDPIEVPVPNGEFIVETGPRAGRITNSTRSPFLLSTVPRPGSTLFTAGPEDLQRRVRQARWIAAGFRGTDPNSVHEYDDAKKLVLQQGGMLGWDLLLEGLGMTGGGPLDEGLDVIASALDEYLLDEPSYPSPTLPVTTMSGGPDYGFGLKSKILHAIIGLLARELGVWVIEACFEQMATIWEGVTQPHAIMVSRTGPIAKAQPILQLVERAVFMVGWALGLACRRRHVYAVPTMVNVALLRVAARLKHFLNWFCLSKSKTVEDVSARIIQFLEQLGDEAWDVELWSDDLAGFDKTVRGHHQRAVGAKIYTKVGTANEVEIWQWANKLPVLGGPWGRQDGGFLYTRPLGGVTTSGLISTNVDGNLVNMPRVLQSVAAGYEITAREALKQEGVTWLGFTAGDDTMILVLKKRFDRGKYLSASNATGLESKLVPGGTFKKKKYEVTRSGGKWRVHVKGYQCRFWSGRVFPEHAKMGFNTEIIGAADAAMEYGPFGDLDHMWRMAAQGTILSDIPDVAALLERAREPRVIAGSVAELSRSAAATRYFLANLEEGRQQLHVGMEVALGLLGQPGTMRFVPEAMALKAGSVDGLWAAYFDMKAWMTKEANQPTWYRETADVAKVYRLTSEA